MSEKTVLQDQSSFPIFIVDKKQVHLGHDSLYHLPSWTRLVFVALRSVSNQTNFPAAAAILNSQFN